jgi:hypothetical protein
MPIGMVELLASYEKAILVVIVTKKLGGRFPIA